MYKQLVKDRKKLEMEKRDKFGEVVKYVDPGSYGYNYQYHQDPEYVSMIQNNNFEHPHLYDKSKPKQYNFNTYKYDNPRGSFNTLYKTDLNSGNNISLGYATDYYVAHTSDKTAQTPRKQF